jgi:aminoglycoside 3-N-acetyltransferase
MIKTELTRSQIVDLLRECVGPNGTIVVPTFPRAAAVDWMRSADVFDVRRSPSGMGSFSEAVRKQPNSKRSMHPTKSVAAVGPLADTIVARHHLSPYPFGPHSPFYMLIERDVKVIGLGVPMSYLSMVHVVEDCNPETFPVRVNLSQPLSKRCVGTDGNAIEVESFVHDLNVVAKANPEKFCRRYLPAESYRIFKKGPTPFFVVQGRRLYESLTMEMSRGNTIYD